MLITVTITNQGSANAGPFWVDFYVNPSRVPHANDPWYSLSSHGIAWLVMGLAEGEAITLQSTPSSYAQEYTIWDGRLPAGTTDLYLYVDSYDPLSGDGAVLELNESNNLSVIHGLQVR